MHDKAALFLLFTTSKTHLKGFTHKKRKRTTLLENKEHLQEVKNFCSPQEGRHIFLVEVMNE